MCVAVPLLFKSYIRELERAFPPKGEHVRFCFCACVPRASPDAEWAAENVTCVHLVPEQKRLADGGSCPTWWLV